MPSESFSKRVMLPLNQKTSTDGGPYSSSNSTGQFNLSGSVSKGGPIPHYRKVIASGGNATTSLIGQEYEFEGTPGSMEYRRTSKFLPYPSGAIHRQVDGLGTIDFGFNPNDPNVLSQVTADNRALTKFYQHVASVETSFKGLVFSGELRESLNMIRSPARSLRRGISHYLNTLRSVGTRLPKRKRPKFVRDTWLEYSFGWKPLISDLDSAITAFYKSRAAKPIFQMVSGYGEDRRLLGSPSHVHTYGPLQWSYREKQESYVYIRYYGIYQNRGNGVSNSHAYGFRPAEFIPTMWELIPYSFLVDYFTNVGNIIQSWSYRFIAMNWTAKTVLREYTNSSFDGKVVPAIDTDSFKFSVTGFPGYRRCTSKRVVRFPSVTPGVPSLELQVPGMGSLKWLNILALSKQHDSTRRALRS